VIVSVTFQVDQLFTPWIPSYWVWKGYLHINQWALF